MSDTRIFFAAERTLLAWVRTGLTVMALGFVVARFGLFLRMIALSNPTLADASALSSTHWPSATLGVILVLSGCAIILGALRNHRVYVSSLPVEDIPLLPIPQLASFLSLSVAIAGVLLAVYLIFA
jgi:putative membrane protein